MDFLYSFFLPHRFKLQYTHSLCISSFFVLFCIYIGFPFERLSFFPLISLSTVCQLLLSFNVLVDLFSLTTTKTPSEIRKEGHLFSWSSPNAAFPSKCKEMIIVGKFLLSRCILQRITYMFAFYSRFLGKKTSICCSNSGIS